MLYGYDDPMQLGAARRHRVPHYPEVFSLRKKVKGCA